MFINDHVYFKFALKKSTKNSQYRPEKFGDMIP